jgi:hypothetical protein
MMSHADAPSVVSLNPSPSKAESGVEKKTGCCVPGVSMYWIGDTALLDDNAIYYFIASEDMRQHVGFLEKNTRMCVVIKQKKRTFSYSIIMFNHGVIHFFSIMYHDDVVDRNAWKRHAHDHSTGAAEDS